MPLSIGDKLGPYEMLALLGEGGMGEVYKARDTRLDRNVAVKISKEKFSERFEREARAVAALNHPHICTLYDVGQDYLVMEYLEGQPVKGPLPVALALKYADQICEALDAAHQKAITHRDLKPGNILVTKQGIKLLDFGLARIESGDATATMALMGTPAYMSPEQWDGKPGDARSDIYALGCVLYEMLTGERAAKDRGPVENDALEGILSGCLEKDPEDRWQSARDIRRALGIVSRSWEKSLPTARARRIWSGWIAVAVLAVFAAVAFLVMWGQPAAEERSLVFQISLPPGTQFVLGAGGGIAISPDGRTVAFVAVAGGSPRKLWLRSLDFVSPHELPGTEGAAYPFWSPDSRSIGFFADEKLKRVDVSGGPPLALADAQSPRGASWSADDTIIYAPLALGGLMSVPSFGGKAIPLTTPDRQRDESSHRWPQSLTGHRFLYFAQNVSSTLRSGEEFIASFDRPQQKIRLIESPSHALYAPPTGRYPGYLLWRRESALMAQPFDPASGRFSGEAVPVRGAERIGVAAALQLAEFSLSSRGTLAFLGGDDLARLTWFDREGHALGNVGQTERYVAVRIAPDGKRVGASLTDPNGRYDVWRIDFRGGAPSRLTFDGNGYDPVWSPDGRSIAYSSLGSAFHAEANGTSRGKGITSSGPVYVNDWSPDGRYWLCSESSAQTQFDLMIIPTGGDGKSQPYLKTPYNELEGQFSPDGKWIAYTSDESGRNEVYVRSFPENNAKFPVSNGGGRLARWRQDGKELFYRALDGRLMAASVRAASQGLEFSTPVALISTMEPAGVFVYPYDISPDGQRILALTPASTEAGSPLTVIVNWQAVLKK
jgi:predicted Ser/Thr protein kinase/dipeptidyl aminopeptidase/acylaminoacyl peptidase